MMSGYSANRHPELLLTPHPRTSDNISFLSYPQHPPPSFKVVVIFVSSLSENVTFTNYTPGTRLPVGSRYNQIGHKSEKLQ